MNKNPNRYRSKYRNRRADSSDSDGDDADGDKSGSKENTNGKNGADKKNTSDNLYNQSLANISPVFTQGGTSLCVLPEYRGTGFGILIFWRWLN